MITALDLPPVLRVQIENEARAAFPRECCGLMEGERQEDTVRITALHRARNLASEADRFEISPADHFPAARSARANGHEIVGCYHSHPDGRAEPSRRDQDGAFDQDFVWLLCAVREGQVETAAFLQENGQFRELMLRNGRAA